MNREIKFRAWDTDNYEMYYQDKDTENGEFEIIWYCQGGEVFFEELQMRDVMVGSSYHGQIIDYAKPNQIVMQFTGLKDKNGVEIYEWDIFHDGHKIWVVYYSKEYGFRLQTGNFSGEKALFPINEELSILGNICQNPDLLELKY